MHLKFSGAPEVHAPRTKVWSLLTDPHFVAGNGPGVQSVEVIDPTHFKVISGFGVGSIKLVFVLDVELADLIPLVGFTMRTRGKVPGSAIDVRAKVTLEDIDAGTRLNWEADTEVSGTVASIGARLLESTARKLTEQFWNDFAEAADAAAGPGKNLPQDTRRPS